MEVVTQPQIEPITLDQVKAWLKVDHDAEDTLLAGLIVAAREKAQHYTNRAFITQTIREFLPIDTVLRPSLGDLQEVVSVKIGDTTLETSEYTVGTDSVGAYVELATMPSADPELTYKAGYGDNANDVPDAVGHAMFLMISAMHENRQDTVKRLPTASEHLLNTVRRWVT